MLQPLGYANTALSMEYEPRPFVKKWVLRFGKLVINILSFAYVMARPSARF